MLKKIILVIALIFIFIFQTIPVTGVPAIKGLDKVAHFLIYFFLTFLFYWNGFILSKAVICSISYGILMEIVQLMAPGRELSFYDFLANCIGSLLFFVSHFVFYNKK